MIRIQISRLAQKELREALERHKEISLQLVQKLEADIEKGFKLIAAFPKSCRLVRGPYRKCLLSRFPYSLVYELEGETIWVDAFAHAKRRPFYWRRRRKQRNS